MTRDRKDQIRDMSDKLNGRGLQSAAKVLIEMLSEIEKYDSEHSTNAERLNSFMGRALSWADTHLIDEQGYIDKRTAVTFFAGICFGVGIYPEIDIVDMMGGEAYSVQIQLPGEPLYHVVFPKDPSKWSPQVKERQAKTNSIWS